MISKSKIFFVDMIFKGTLRAREITLDSEYKQGLKEGCKRYSQSPLPSKPLFSKWAHHTYRHCLLH